MTEKDMPLIIELTLARLDVTPRFVTQAIRDMFITRNRSVINYMCGTGWHHSLLKKAGVRRVVNIDISSEACELASKRNRKAEVICTTLSDPKVLELSMQEEYHNEHQFTTITVFNSKLELLPYTELKSTISSAYDILRKKGLFIYEYYNRPSNRIYTFNDTYNFFKPFPELSGFLKKIKISVLEDDERVNVRVQNDVKETSFDYTFSHYSHLLPSYVNLLKNSGFNTKVFEILYDRKSRIWSRLLNDTEKAPVNGHLIILGRKPE